jgi:hypothetical protein
VVGSARPAWPRWGAAGLAWMLWGLTLLGVLAAAWLDQLLRQAGRPELSWLGSGNLPLVGAAVIAVTVGAVLASRRPGHPVGWLLVAMGMSLTLSGAASSYRYHGLVARPGTLPAASYLAGLADGLNIVYLSCAGFVLLLTPTGSLPSPRWRWWARVAAAGAAVFLLASAANPAPLYPPYRDITNPLGVPALAQPPLDAAAPLSGLIVLVALVVGAWSLVVRFRHARGVERQQLRWLAWGAALAAVALVVGLLDFALRGEDTILFQPALAVCLALLPLSTGAAILRYRLYDLDRIISRSLAYGLLTVLLGLGYAAVVLGLGRLLRQDSSLVVAAATLAMAAVFQPARRRIQTTVDRRFNRRRHDAGQLITAFSARLRDQVDLATLTGELLAVVDQTMQPTRASLWLRPRAPSNKAEGQAATSTAP